MDIDILTDTRETVEDMCLPNSLGGILLSYLVHPFGKEQRILVGEKYFPMQVGYCVQGDR